MEVPKGSLGRRGRSETGLVIPTLIGAKIRMTSSWVSRPIRGDGGLRKFGEGEGGGDRQHRTQVNYLCLGKG